MTRALCVAAALLLLAGSAQAAPPFAPHALSVKLRAGAGAPRCPT